MRLEQSTTSGASKGLAPRRYLDFPIQSLASLMRSTSMILNPFDKRILVASEFVIGRSRAFRSTAQRFPTALYSIFVPPFLLIQKTACKGSHIQSQSKLPLSDRKSN